MTIPTKASHSRIYDIFARWSTLSYRYAAWVILAALLVTVVCGLYVSRNLGINTDTTDMLSEHLPFRVNMKHYNKTFPQDMETLLVVLDAPTPEQVYLAAERLAARLALRKYSRAGTNHRSPGRGTTAHSAHLRKSHLVIFCFRAYPSGGRVARGTQHGASIRAERDKRNF